MNKREVVIVSGVRTAIGATGTVIAVKALYEFKRTAGKYTVVSMCIGGVQGIAALFKR